MFNDNSSKVFWNIIKNQEENKNIYDESYKLTVNESKVKRGSNCIEELSNQFGSGEPMEIIEKLPTYKKICILQGLLKEMKSTKERFEDNKKELLEKLSNNCYNFYKSKLGMKEIYDYCNSSDPEIKLNYILYKNSKEKFSNNYDIFYYILFLLRNNNEIMLNIIKSCPNTFYPQFSDFLVNFFYENTIKSSFNDEELLIIIYLVIEDIIINKLPKSFSTVNNKNQNYLNNNNILYFIFKSITRKTEIRNFTCEILSEALLKIGEIHESLSIVSDKLINTDLSKTTTCDSIIIPDIKQRNYTMYREPKKIPDKGDIVFPFKDRNITNSSFMIITDEDESTIRQSETVVGNKINVDKIVLNSFFDETDVTLNYLNKKLSEYEKETDEDSISNAMRDYIDLQINQISTDDSEIFSNKIKNYQLKVYIALNETESSQILVETILNNYKIITNAIDEILNKIKENITSLPYIVKSILDIMNTLIIKKYPKVKKKSIDYQRLMFLSNFLMGNIISPLISNPDYNGIITSDVISKLTKENLKIIAKVFNKMFSGNLFNNKNNFEFTIFNKYIIETLPKIFDITLLSINNQQKFNLSKKIQYLIDTSDSIGEKDRNVNYDYFAENQENIQLQSICFSWLNLVILIDIFKKCNELHDIEKYKNYFAIFEKFKQTRKICVENHNENIKSGEHDFFFFEKITFSPEFQKNIDHIIEDNVFFLISDIDKDKDDVTMFKSCLVDVLAYVNILHKEDFNIFVQKKRESIIRENDIFLLLLNKETNKKWKKTQFEGGGICDTPTNISNQFHTPQNENLKGFGEKLDEDANFKDVIFPHIVDSVKSELSHNLDTNKVKRIVFCTSYLQLHIDDLPQKYKDNNYCLLIMEIIKIGEKIINELNVSILHQFYLKYKEGEKINMIINNNFLQIKKMEKNICLMHLFEKLKLSCKLNVKKDGLGSIKNIKYEKVDSSKSSIHSIQSFIDIVPDFRKYEEKVEDILELEENVEIDKALHAYFKDLKSLIKKQNIMSRYTQEEYEMICSDLENYVMLKLYDKLYPKESTQKDNQFYKKCCRLDFVKPEHLIKDKNLINEKLWLTSMELINEMDHKYTPFDKVRSFGKAFVILQNSITFCSGKDELGVDDTITFLNYIILKSKPRNIFSNSKYCQLFLNPDLSKKQYGILLTQFEVTKNIIFNMKHTDLIGVTEDEFGKDE